MRRHAVLIAALPLLSSCSALSKLSAYICLDEALEAAGYTREDLETVDLDGDGVADGDDLLKEVIETSRAVLGDSAIIDCTARDDGASLVEDISEGVGASPDEEGLPDKAHEGDVVEVENPDELPDKVADQIEENPGENPDVSLLIDTTGSMWDDAQIIADSFEEIRQAVEDKGGRLSVSWYGDNQSCDDPWFGQNDSGLMDPMDAELNRFVNNILDEGLTGGCDWPESMYDGLYEVGEGLNWESPVRQIIVITDAPALEPPKTNHTREEVVELMDRKRITVDIVYTAVTY
jgi:hypothetical protein